MTQQEILLLQTTKTEKIRLLLALGLSRKSVAEIMMVGYGFVQNVYAKHYTTNQRSGLNQFEFIEFNRNFGIEIEAYNVEMSQLMRAFDAEGVNYEQASRLNDKPNLWKITTDGSIQGQNTFEIVSPILKGRAGLEELRKVCLALKKCNAYVNKSCGMHVHFCGADFKFKQWRNIYINYARLEKVIDAFMPCSRRGDNNQYCKGFLNNPNFEQKILDATNISKIEVILSRKRYYKINPMSYARHKTIEFRQHSGTIEFCKIENWVMFLHNLVEFSKTSQVSKTPDLSSTIEFQQPEIVGYYHERTQDLCFA